MSDFFEALAKVGVYLVNNRSWFWLNKAAVARERFDTLTYKTYMKEADYSACLVPANYPVPALLMTFEYWPAKERCGMKPAIFGHDHYKPGRWREFLNTDDQPEIWGA